MKTRVCEDLGIEFPVFAFTHCRDVVAAVSKAGGLGVLGAVGFSPEQLEIELNWIDDNVGDAPYGVDIVLPNRYEGEGEMDVQKLTKDLQDMIPKEHLEFTSKILDENNIPKLPEDANMGSGLMGWTAATAMPQVEVILEHPKVGLLANALGTPPTEIIDKLHNNDKLVAALCGTPAQAGRHKAAGIDIVIAQGYEGGGHTGDIGSVVLWPQIIEEVGDLPVLAAGGIATGEQMAAALALGAQGIWTGSIWLTVEEASGTQAQIDRFLTATSKDTIRSRSFTGKPCRMLKNNWTQAWENPDTPDPLGMPLQYMVAQECSARVHRHPEQGQDVAFNPVGQVVGMMQKRKRSADLVMEIVQDCISAFERMESLMKVDMD